MLRLVPLLLLLLPFQVLSAQVYNLDPVDFIKKIEGNPRAQILDLRDPQEYAYRHVPGAVNILPADISFLEEVRDQLSASDTLYIYCRIGKTKEVTQLLLDNGYRVIYNLRGGTVAWDAYLEKERRRKSR